MGRGLERRRVLVSDKDKTDFIERLRAALEETQTQCLAWALMSNHYHLGLRVGVTPLSVLMRKLVGGYAAAYNRRHQRVGYVFQNRYKSILCDEERYLRALVRYIHLNPLEARVVNDMKALDSYRWTGHAVLLGRRGNDWQQTEPVLARFGDTLSQARRRYRQFVKSGLGERDRVELDGGGLVRSYGGWQNIERLRTAHERIIGDERILGDSAFVERALQQDELQIERDCHLSRQGWDLEGLIAAVCRHFEIESTAITGRGRKNALSRAKAVICYLGVRILKFSSNALATRLQISQPAVSTSIRRGQRYCREHALSMETLKL